MHHRINRRVRPETESSGPACAMIIPTTNPIALPANVTVTDSTRNCIWISALRAPTALRIPISLVRSATAVEQNVHDSDSTAGEYQTSEQSEQAVWSTASPDACSRGR